MLDKRPKKVTLKHFDRRLLLLLHSHYQEEVIQSDHVPFEGKAAVCKRKHRSLRLRKCHQKKTFNCLISPKMLDQPSCSPTSPNILYHTSFAAHASQCLTTPKQHSRFKQMTADSPKTTCPWDTTRTQAVSRRMSLWTPGLHDCGYRKCFLESYTGNTTH